jgi:two-component system OmpR family response regulator
MSPPGASQRVLIVDDDVELASMLGDYLTGEGFSVERTVDGAAVLADPAVERYDALILDVMLPRISGIELLRRLRQRTAMPIIMLTAKGDERDRALGMELGADDYIAKPYFARELVARLRAVLRRHAAPGLPVQRTTSTNLGLLQIDFDTREASVSGEPLDLTASEFGLLAALARDAGRVVTKNELSNIVLGREHQAYDRSIDVHVSNLRRKLTATEAGVVIETARSVGYRLFAP